MSNSPFLKAGLPLITLTVGGWLLLSKVTQNRIDIQEAHKQEVDSHAPAIKQRAKAFDIGEELKRLQGEVLESDYKNKPVPFRPNA